MRASIRRKAHQQLGQLLDFLEDPDAYLKAERPSHSKWTALRVLTWYDGDSDVVDEAPAFGGVFRPWMVLGRRESLEPLVYDVLNLQEPQDRWLKRLERCSMFASSAPFEEVLIAKLASRDEANFDLRVHEASICSDIERHGPVICPMVLREPRLSKDDDDANFMRSFMSVYGQVFGGLEFTSTGETFAGTVDDLTPEGAYGFSLGVLVASTVVDSVEPTQRKALLKHLIERARVLDLLYLSTTRRRVYAEIANLATLRVSRIHGRSGERPRDVKEAAAKLARFTATQDPAVFNAP